jgi:small GTP-binding protein
VLVRKVCMVGDFGVGKTSLVARYVHQTFSEAYLTTVGVKIDTHQVRLASGTDLKLVIWDIAGTDALRTVEQNYLQGAAGLLLVADGTRAATLETALALEGQVDSVIGSRPRVLLVNKLDLAPQWELDPTDPVPGRPALACSARSGAGVEAAFVRLAEQLVAG